MLLVSYEEVQMSIVDLLFIRAIKSSSTKRVDKVYKRFYHNQTPTKEALNTILSRIVDELLLDHYPTSRILMDIQKRWSDKIWWNISENTTVDNIYDHLINRIRMCPVNKIEGYRTPARWRKRADS